MSWTAEANANRRWDCQHVATVSKLTAASCRSQRVIKHSINVPVSLIKACVARTRHVPCGQRQVSRRVRYRQAARQVAERKPRCFLNTRTWRQGDSFGRGTDVKLKLAKVLLMGPDPEDLSVGNVGIWQRLQPLTFELVQLTRWKRRSRVQAGGLLPETLPHLFAFENFFELPLDPLDRDVRHGCVCWTEPRAPLSLSLALPHSLPPSVGRPVGVRCVCRGDCPLRCWSPFAFTVDRFFPPQRQTPSPPTASPPGAHAGQPDAVEPGSFIHGLWCVELCCLCYLSCSPFQDISHSVLNTSGLYFPPLVTGLLLT